MMRIANWNIARAVPTQRRAGAVRDHIEAVDADLWVLTETHEELQHSTQGELRRVIDAEKRADFIANLYEPYHEGLTHLVAARLEQFGTCLILDCYSFPTIPLPSEPDQRMPRPDICIGTDAFHTPAELAEALIRAFAAEGFSVERDAPFSGTIVPTGFYLTDERVHSVMIEVRRGLYCDEETGAPNKEFERVREKVERAVGGVLERL